MTAKEFYDWQTRGGTNDVMKLVNCLESADIAWCTIGGVAVNHWAHHPMVTQDVDLVVAAESIQDAVTALKNAGFTCEEFEWSMNFKGSSALSIQLTTESNYLEFPARAVPADVHGILMRVASLEDTLTGKVRACTAPDRRRSKKLKDLADIARLVEAHPALLDKVPEEIRGQLG